ncbi:hypothetical protein, partial [Pseudomonas syringae group genomosp. 7]|uniref:hypothetical protein n=1 Tax=Pseudomonas syringae group genomosp. 7 TaxID=251699 RepID=UPI00377019DA
PVRSTYSLIDPAPGTRNPRWGGCWFGFLLWFCVVCWCWVWLLVGVLVGVVVWCVGCLFGCFGGWWVGRCFWGFG